MFYYNKDEEFQLIWVLILVGRRHVTLNTNYEQKTNHKLRLFYTFISQSALYATENSQSIQMVGF